MGISVDAFRIAGGIVLLLVGVRMVFAQGTQSEPGGDTMAGRDIAVFPLGMPYGAGPAAIMSIVLLTENDLHSIPQQGLHADQPVSRADPIAANEIERLRGRSGERSINRFAASA